MTGLITFFLFVSVGINCLLVALALRQRAKIIRQREHIINLEIKNNHLINEVLRR